MAFPSSVLVADEQIVWKLDTRFQEGARGGGNKFSPSLTRFEHVPKLLPIVWCPTWSLWFYRLRPFPSVLGRTLLASRWCPPPHAVYDVPEHNKVRSRTCPVTAAGSRTQKPHNHYALTDRDTHKQFAHNFRPHQPTLWGCGPTIAAWNVRNAKKYPISCRLFASVWGRESFLCGFVCVFVWVFPEWKRLNHFGQWQTEGTMKWKKHPPTTYLPGKPWTKAEYLLKSLTSHFTRKKEQGGVLCHGQGCPLVRAMKI